MKKKTLLTAQHISYSVGTTTLVHDISLSVDQSSIVALLGPNGAGKTTLMHVLAGLNRAQNKTSLLFNEHDITGWSIDKRVEHGLVFLPQHTSLFQSLSAQDNLRVVFDYHPVWKNQSFEEFNDLQKFYLEAAGITHILNRPARVLSGGQKRKLELVRALLMKPKLIICDEPFAGVDPKSIFELRTLLSETCPKNNVSVIISDHNVEQLIAISSYVYMVLGGKIIAHGTPDEVLSDKATQEHYLGSHFRQ